MKSYLTYLVLFVVLFGISTAGILFYQSYLKKSAATISSNELSITPAPITPAPITPTPITSPSPTTKLTTTSKGPFIWGGTYHPVLDWTQANISNELKMVHDQGINYVRFSYVPLDNADTKMADRVFQATKENNIKIVLILEPPISNYADSSINYQKIGNDYAAEAIKRAGDQVDYYQLLNEVGGTALKANGDGQTFDQFDPIKYKHLKEMITGLGSTVRRSDPTAKTIVSNQWLHYGILDKLIADKVDFDIIGWNWFPAGIDMDRVQYAPGKTINMLQKLASYHKDVWLTEFNRDHGSLGTDGEALQAQYLQDKLVKYYKSGVFKAIFVHSLFEDVVNSKTTQENDRHWGIFSTPNTTSHLPKKAAEVYSAIIKKYPNLPTN